MTEESDKQFVERMGQLLADEDEDGQSWHRLIALALRGAATQCKVIDEVAAERRRQIAVEGWTPEHDDDHADGALYKAAAAYTIFGSTGIIYDENTAPPNWPVAWAKKWWKPKGRRRDLIRAAALLVAEIERLDRAALGKPTPQPMEKKP